MKTFLLFITVTFVVLQSKAQQDCNLIQNSDPSLKNESLQTVFVTVLGKKDKFNIKFWRFTNKFTISCFMVTKDTFCVDQSSSVTFNFNDNSRFTYKSDKKQNCRGELDKDFNDEEIAGQKESFSQKRIATIEVSGIHKSQSFIVDEKTAAAIQHSFNCIINKDMSAAKK